MKTRKDILLVCFLVLLALLFGGCKEKKETPQTPKQSETSTSTDAKVEEKIEGVKEDASKVVDAVKEEAKAVEEKVAEVKEEVKTEVAKVAAEAASKDLVPLPIELPAPCFKGTPTNIRGVENLEKPRGEPRPPFLAPAGAVNVALNKAVTASDDFPIVGELEMVTDGDKNGTDGHYVELGPMQQYVTIDLDAEHNIYAVLIWHYHQAARVYFDVIVQVSNDPDFIEGVTTIYNNDHDNSAGMGVGKDLHYVETAEGRLIDAKGVQGQYVRCYSSGSNSSDMNHYVEVEVFGKPVK